MGKLQKKKLNNLKKNSRKKVNHMKKDSKETWSNRVNSVLMLIGLLEIPQKLCEVVKFIIDLF